ncbi:Riboflavin transporter ImpX [anaerobic digester metagenome]|nr:DMT family transporter [Lentimicrobiaceae bacterium]
MMSNKVKSYVAGSIAICISATLWGLDGVVLTPRLYNLNIQFVVFIIHALPFVMMNVFLFNEYRHLKFFSLRELLFIFLIALTGGALGTMAIVKALFLVDFKELSVVVLLQKLQPVFAISLAAIILKERLNRDFALWAGLAIVAGYFLTFGLKLPDFETGSNTALAAGYSLIAAFFFGSATVLGKGVLRNLSFSTATFYRYGFTSLIMLVIVAFSGKINQFQFVTVENWKIILIISFTVGSGAIFLYYYGLKKVPAMLSAIFELFFPLSAIVFDYIFNHKVLSLVQWVSVVIMLVSILKLSMSSPRKVSAKDADKQLKSRL